MNFANKLSSHVLGMKFMRRTKNQVDKERVEKKHREHFAPPSVTEVEDIKPDLKDHQKTTGRVEEVPSYSQCEKWIFGRQSFGGFNPEVERNVERGIWKNHYVGEPIGTNEEEEPVNRELDNEVDVPDEEMAATYGSIIGTLAKHFKKKRDRGDNSKKQKQAVHNPKSGNHQQKFQNKQKFQEGDARADNVRNQHQGYRKRNQKRRYDHDDKHEHQKQSSFSLGRHQQRNNESGTGTPPRKKRFMKPSDN